MDFDISGAYMTKAETSMISVRIIICEAQAIKITPAVAASFL